MNWVEGIEMKMIYDEVMLLHNNCNIRRKKMFSLCEECNLYFYYELLSFNARDGIVIGKK